MTFKILSMPLPHWVSPPSTPLPAPMFQPHLFTELDPYIPILILSSDNNSFYISKVAGD